MYRHAYQGTLLSLFFSCGSKPLNIWDVHIKDGYISKFLDNDLKSTVLEIGGTNVSTTYITCPKGNEVLGIRLPYLIMVVKNLKKYFSFEVTILDESGIKRRFRISNFQSTTQILPMCTVMPIGLSEGWNQIQFNLSDFTKRAYKKQFIEVLKVKVNANIRLRRIYCAERLLSDDELPAEYKLFFPLGTKRIKKNKEAVVKKPEEEPNVAKAEQLPPPAPPSETTEGASEALEVGEGGASKQAVEDAGEAEKPVEEVQTEEDKIVPGKGDGEPGEEGQIPLEGENIPEEEPEAEGESEAEGEPLSDGEQPTEGEQTAEGEPAAEVEAETAIEEAAEVPTPS